MKTILSLAISAFLLVSCHESLEQRAAREAREFTRRNCPTPVVNCSRTDSVKFDTNERNYIYYCSFVEQFDDAQLVDSLRGDILAGLRREIQTNVSLKPYIEAGFSFTYIVRSGSNPEVVLFDETIKIRQ